MLNGHGDDLYLCGNSIKYNFSSNVYYKGCPKPLLDELRKRIGSIQNYPSPSAEELSILAAKHYGLSAEHFLFTNGATEAFYLIAQTFKGKTAAILGPTFSEYEDACKVHELDYSVCEFQNLFDHSPNLVFICNPNNPDGSIIPATELEQCIQKHQNTTFVVDEAYIEFANNLTSLIPLVDQYSNLIVVRSLTKTFTIPGLRLGYLAANSNRIQQLKDLKMPWSVNALAINAGEFIFNNYNQLQFDATQLIKENRDFIDQLKCIDWLRPKPSHTSYSLFQLIDKKAAHLKQYLIDKHQILIRDATNFNGLNAEYIRLAVQSQEANVALINALKQWH